MSGERPAVRLLHHLARTGGTIISRCLAAMRGVTVLSEVHPRGAEVALQFDPLFQAQYWFKLLSDADARALRDGSASFTDCIVRIAERAAERGEALVVRDWSHLDFMARPFFDEPTGRLSLAEALADSCRTVQAATVRHPASQWLSWSRFMPESGLSLADFMAGNRRFAEQAVEIGFMRYEDFARYPGPPLIELCRRLELEFDPEYAYRWIFYRTVNGDLDGLGHYSIEPAQPPRVSAELREALERNADYLRTLELLGYGPDWIEVAPGPMAAATT
jgi:protein O-GlcNAc transferase